MNNKLTLETLVAKLNDTLDCDLSTLEPYARPIYTIAVTDDDRSDWSDWAGFYHEADAAITAVLTNRCDLQDHAYGFCVVTARMPGMYRHYQVPGSYLCFRWNSSEKKWEHADGVVPKCLDCISG